MEINWAEELLESMKSGRHGPSDQGAKKELNTGVVSNARLPSETTINSYISVQTGDEFSSEFLRDRLTPKVAQNGPSVMSQNRNVKAEVDDDRNPQMGYEDFARILGLHRMDSKCESEVFYLASVRGCPVETDHRWPPVDKTRTCHNNNDDSSGHMTREANGEAGFGCAKFRLRVPPITIPQSPYTLLNHEQGLPDISQPGKMRILCSFGGKILPRPSDGKLRYVGGETRIISIRKNISWRELLVKTSRICNQTYTLKYQLPGEDVDALVSISSDEDFQNMMEEYHGLQRSSGSQRLRIFLIPSSESENRSSSLESGSISIQQSSPDYEYVVAVNGVIDPSPRKNSGDLLVANEKRKHNSKFEHTPSFIQDFPPPHRLDLPSPHRMEIKDGPGISHQIQIPSDPPFSTRSPIQSPCFSPTPVQQADSKNVIMQYYDDMLHKESTNCNSTLSGQQIYDPSFVKPNIQGSKLQFHAHQTNREFSAPPVASCNPLFQVDRCPLGIYVAENKLPHLEKRISQAGDQGITDPCSPMTCSNPSIGSQLEKVTSLCHLPQYSSKDCAHGDLQCDKITNCANNKSEKLDVGETNKTSETMNIQNEQNQLEPLLVVGGVTDCMSITVGSLASSTPHVVDSTNYQLPLAMVTVEEEEIHAGIDSEDVNSGERQKDESINDAMIAEIEAGIYGLQIIKNVDLEELRELGSGTYGTVYHGKWRGTDVAIKRIKKSCFSGRSSGQDQLTMDFWREAQILSKLQHPNVVAFYGVVPDGPGGTLATVTEYMVNGSLRNVLLKKDRSLDSRKKLLIATDAAFGMEYLHSKNIVHFDLKCDNLLVNLRDPQRPICKVGDFGLSRIKRNTLISGGVRGTLPWMAPELLNGCSNKVSEKVDVFSFGITMWEILTGEEPYMNMHCGAIIGGILKDTLRPPIPAYCNSKWKKLMEQCWLTDPDARPSFSEIADRLRYMSSALQSKRHRYQRSIP